MLLDRPDGRRLADQLLVRCRFPAAGSAVVCGVSGGADSLALLMLACHAGCAVTAVHVDHALRPGSADEAALVADVARDLGAHFRETSAPVNAGPNLEARARAARLAALGPDALLGHTADDQAETVLLAMLRGAGLDGLSGMSSRRHPLLALRRSDTHALCAAVGVQPFADPTNTDMSIRRNRVRAELLPLLDAIAERDVAAVIARQAGLLRDDAGYLDELSSAIDPTDARAVAAAPRPLARRALRRWLATALGGYPPDAAAVERVLAVARGEAVACEIAAGPSVSGPSVGVRVTRSAQRLSIVEQKPSL